MATIYDCSDNAGLLTGMRLARTAIGKGELVVIPTDTVYGIAADAFDANAVQRLLDAKGRTRQAPPPVLIPGIDTLDALAEEVPDDVRTLVAAFWPGGLTVILPARSSLSWDLGETGGTVALRMPSNTVALELLSETGPLAVSSANLSGLPAAMTAAEAEGMLGDSVSVYLDAGQSGGDYVEAAPGVASTIVDATGLTRDGGELVIVREGVIAASEIWAAIESARSAEDERRETAADAADAESAAGAADATATSTTAAPTAEKSRTGDSKTGGVKTDKPKAAKPQATKPKTGEPTTESNPEKSNPDEPKTGEPKTDEPKTGEPKPGEPKPDEPSTGPATTDAGEPDPADADSTSIDFSDRTDPP